MEFEESGDIVVNTEPFDCSICFMPCAIGTGIVLRNCLHTFCFDCIRSHIMYSTDVQVTCPHMENEYSCDRFLQDRELRSFMNDDERQEFLKRSLTVAELTIENTIHCLTANCPGWCVLGKDNIEIFNCPVCHQANCLTCKTIHKSETCDDYLNSLTNYTVTQADKMSKSEIDRLLANNMAMLCPKCWAIIEKNGGCDGMTCSLCKTPLCWATKGARWGPGGIGDYSGGCGCGRNGKCVPQCQNCH
jgi:RanBP-type and C3HC4-type zinc finger-containing protein 1